MRLLLFLLAAFLIPGCFWSYPKPPPWFADSPCGVFYTTPGGITWCIYGPTPPNPLGVDNPPDGVYTTDPATVSAAIDSAVDAVAQQYPANAVWPTAQRLTWKLVNDFAFPDGGAVDSTTGYATGETQTVGGVATQVIFALWSRHALPEGAPEPDPSTLPAPWTLLGPGTNNYNYWRYGDVPLLPAIGYEFRVNVLHVSNQ